jgi:hypothetical protein
MAISEYPNIEALNFKQIPKRNYSLFSSFSFLFSHLAFSILNFSLSALMRQHSVHHQFGTWSKYLLLAGVFLIIPFTQSIGQDAGNLSVRDEFPKTFDAAKEQYHNTMNCFISKAVQAIAA